MALHQKWREGHFEAVCKNHVSQASVGRNILLETVLPLPPLAEQVRIATKAQMLLEQVQSTQDRLARASVVLKRFRQAVLKAACTGSLTLDWRETAGADSVKGTSAAGRTRADRVEPICEAPEDWSWVELSDLCDPARAICYGVIKLGPDIEGGVPCLRTSDVKHLFIDDSSIKTISPDIAIGYKRTQLVGGEVLVNIRGTLGGVAVVPTGFAGWNISRELALVPVTSANASYIAYWIGGAFSQQWLSEVAKGVAYTGINIEDLKRLPVALPTADEQQEIVRRTAQLLAGADAIERRVASLAKQGERIAATVLAKAFRGELVPTEAEIARMEGRHFESANALLERAQLMPAEAKKKKRTDIRRRAAMKELEKEALKATIQSMPKGFCTFSDLYKNHPGDYESLKEMVFALLDDPTEGIQQVFDRKTKTVGFRQVSS